MDFEDYLRHWGLPQWEGGHPILCRFKATRCADLPAFRAWIASELRHQDSASVRPCFFLRRRPRLGAKRTSRGALPCPYGLRGRQDRPDAYAVNGALSLLNLVRPWLVRQLGAQGQMFLEKGGFTERLYKARSGARNRQWA